MASNADKPGIQLQYSTSRMPDDCMKSTDIVSLSWNNQIESKDGQKFIDGSL